MATRLSILHIAVHMGEGVGKAISGLTVSDIGNRHEIILLEQPKKTDHIDFCRTHNVSVTVCPDDGVLSKHLLDSDVVVVNWWNHPAMILVLQKLCGIPSRVLLWSHVNGLNYPLLTAKFASVFDGCLFTSPISLQVSHWSDEQREELRQKSTLVYGLGDFHPFGQPYKQDYELHDPIRVGYVGTLDYAKLHPNFLSYCRAVLEKGINARFVIAGELSKSLEDDVKREGLTESIEFLGFQKNIPELLTTFDIFGYLLNPDNFATTENALLEAMAAGLPIITGYGEAERAIITDSCDGFAVADISSYASRMEKLAQSKSLRKQLGSAARDTVCKKYNASDNVLRFNKAITQVLKKSKSEHDFQAVMGDSPFDCFLSCCPENARSLFVEAAQCNSRDRHWTQLKDEAQTIGDIFKTQRKGSVFQFSNVFPSDKKLRKICELYE